MKTTILIILTVLLSGCSSLRKEGSGITYKEWREKVRLEAEAKALGVPYVYKTNAQLRVEGDELHAIMAETINSMVKPVKKEP